MNDVDNLQSDSRGRADRPDGPQATDARDRTAVGQQRPELQGRSPDLPSTTRPSWKLGGLVLLIAVAGAILWFVFLHKGAAESEAEAKPAARVETVVLQRQSIAQTLEAFGVVEAAPGAEYTTPATYESVVAALHAAAGSRVNAGDVVMEIAPSPDSKLQYESARTTLKLAEQSLAAAQERYDLKLATSQDLITAQQAERDAKQKAASYEARGMSGDGKLRAPVTGVISKLDLIKGALVTAGSPLFSVATQKSLEARLSVESSSVTQIAKGQAVTLESTQQNNPAPVMSAVRVVGASLSPTTGAADVRVAVPPGASLLLGEHVRAIIEVVKKDAALVVPRSAVLPDDDNKQVLFTVKDGKAVKHEVEVGISSGDLVEVQAKDLNPGDTVVTLGNYELNDGMEILTPEKEKELAGGDAADDDKGGGADKKDAAGEKNAADEKGTAAAKDADAKDAGSAEGGAKGSDAKEDSAANQGAAAAKGEKP